MSYLQNKIDRYILKNNGEWSFITTANLGDLSGNVNSNIAGMVYARLSNGQVITVYNTIAPSRFDTHVKIGQNRNLPGVWQVIEIREVYSIPAIGLIRNHAAQHMLGADDMLPVSREQIMRLTVFAHPTVAFSVNLYGANIITLAGSINVANQTINLSSYIPTAGAVYVNIECSATNGAISVHVGNVFADPNFPLPIYIPVPDAGKNRIASVLLYEFMPRLLQRHIIVPMPIEQNPLDFVASIGNRYYMQYVYEMDTDGKGFIVLDDGIAIIEPLLIEEI